VASGAPEGFDRSQLDMIVNDIKEVEHDPDYKTNALRQKHHRKLEAKIEALLKTKPTSHWLAVMAKADIPAGPINNVAQALAHPQVAARNMLVSVPDGSGGTLKLAGNPIKMSAFDDPKTRRPAPDLDSDRDAILSKISATAVGVDVPGQTLPRPGVAARARGQ
jgi:CoA:oxalate CoA-transferase